MQNILKKLTWSLLEIDKMDNKVEKLNKPGVSILYGMTGIFVLSGHPFQPITKEHDNQEMYHISFNISWFFQSQF